MITTIGPKTHIVIDRPPIAGPSKFFLGPQERQGQLCVTSFKIGGVPQMNGDRDLFDFSGEQYPVRAGQTISLEIRSNWEQPLTVSTHPEGRLRERAPAGVDHVSIRLARFRNRLVEPSRCAADGKRLAVPMRWLTRRGAVSGLWRAGALANAFAPVCHGRCR